MFADEKSILVINPNSNHRVTDELAHAVQNFQIPKRLHIVCMRLAEGPFGIETDADIQSVVDPLQNTIQRESGYDAYIIACYSDPGVMACREITEKPVLGMQISAHIYAQAICSKVGVIALSSQSIERHLNYLNQHGLNKLYVSERPLNISVEESIESEDTLDKLLVTTRLLIEEDGAEAIILGCAGLCKYKQVLRSHLGVPIIDPVQAALSHAQSFIL